MNDYEVKAISIKESAFSATRWIYRAFEPFDMDCYVCGGKISWPVKRTEEMSEFLGYPLTSNREGRSHGEISFSKDDISIVMPDVSREELFRFALEGCEYLCCEHAYVLDFCDNRALYRITPVEIPMDCDSGSRASVDPEIEKSIHTFAIYNNRGLSPSEEEHASGSLEEEHFNYRCMNEATSVIQNYMVFNVTHEEADEIAYEFSSDRFIFGAVHRNYISLWIYYDEECMKEHHYPEYKFVITTQEDLASFAKHNSIPDNLRLSKYLQYVCPVVDEKAFRESRNTLRTYDGRAWYRGKAYGKL